MSVRKVVQRSNVNEEQIKFSDFPKSGYNLSYTSQFSGKLGKLHVGGYQFVMPNDKISGDSHMKVQFEPLAVPMIAPLQFHTHNFYIPFRDVIGSDFEEFMSPENGYAPDVAQLPMFSLEKIVTYMENSLDFPPGVPTWSTYPSWQTSFNTDYLPKLKAILVASKLPDFYDEYVAHLDSLGTPTASDFPQWIVNYYIFALDPFIGENSYLDQLGYPILNHEQIKNYVSAGGGLSAVASTDEVSELALRCNFAVWFDRYRNVNVERKRDFYALGLNYKKWTATALTGAQLFHLLLPRYRNWAQDPFTSSLIDDPSRHVYAQINPLFTVVDGLDVPQSSYVNDSDLLSPATPSNDQSSLGRAIISQNLQYMDENGVNRSVTLSLPSSIFGVGPSMLAGKSADLPGEPSLDLLVLKRAKMFENYLKRNYYYGDEYQDRMAAHYGARVSDSRVNRPEYLSGNSFNCEVDLQTANVSTADTDAGQKTAVVSAQSQGGDRFDFYCEEFGLVLTIVSLTPDAYYDPEAYQHSLCKLMDFPFPEFANQAEELSRRKHIQRNGIDAYVTSSCRPFGHHPQYYGWRGRVNDLHGNSLSTRRFYTFSRIWTYATAADTPVLDANFVHCKPYLDMFISNDPLNDVWFGQIHHNFYVERVLPVVTENL